MTIGDTPDTGYCIHALNAVYISAMNKWIRLDVRGNKNGVQAKFSLEEEYLAFPIRKKYAEIDYKEIYSEPHIKTIQVLQKNNNCIEMYIKFLPDSL